MIAFAPEPAKTCDACNGVCMDGTACTGAFRSREDGWPLVRIDLREALAHAAFAASVAKALRPHPRHQTQPRSPRPRFRKGSKR